MISYLRSFPVVSFFLTLALAVPVSGQTTETQMMTPAATLRQAVETTSVVTQPLAAPADPQIETPASNQRAEIADTTSTLEANAAAKSGAATVETTSTATPAADTTQPLSSDSHEQASAFGLDLKIPGSINPPVIPESAETSTTLPTGTIYQILKPGDGQQADTSSTRRIHYVLWLTDGKYLESSLDAETPMPFEFIPQSDGAIRGMDDGTNGMKIGEIRKLYIPAAQAYGSKQHGNIPPNSNLIFVVQLVDLRDPAEFREAIVAQDPTPQPAN